MDSRINQDLDHMPRNLVQLIKKADFLSSLKKQSEAAAFYQNVAESPSLQPWG